MDEQQRAILLGEIATEAGEEREAFLNDAERQFMAFLDANRERLKALGGMVLIDDDPEYLSVTEKGSFRSRTRFQDDLGEWVSETEEIESGAELIEIYNPADLYAAFADAAREEAGLDAHLRDDELPDEADRSDTIETVADAADGTDEADASEDDWIYNVPAPKDKPDAARLLYDLALTFQERSQVDQAQLLDEFQDAAQNVAEMLGDSKVLEDEDERLWFRGTGAFEGEVVPERDDDGQGEPEWRPLTTPEDLVQYYDPTDLFGDLAEAIAEAWPEVAPELDDAEDGSVGEPGGLGDTGDVGGTGAVGGLGGTGGGAAGAEGAPDGHRDDA